MPRHDQMSAIVQGLPLTGLIADICMSGLDLTRSSVMVRRVLPPICVSGLVGGTSLQGHLLAVEKS